MCAREFVRMRLYVRQYAFGACVLVRARVSVLVCVCACVCVRAWVCVSLCACGLCARVRV